MGRPKKEVAEGTKKVSYSPKTINVVATFIEEVLGTCSANPEIHAEFIASNAPDAKSRTEEIEAIGVEGAVEKSMTVFPFENGKPFFYDYQWKGFFKDTCSALSRVPGTLSEDMRAFKKIIDGNIFVQPRKIVIALSGPMGTCQRPLRAQTLQGERVALANSQTVPAGSTCSFRVLLLNPELEGVVREWLAYGELRGTGQWRNSGKGRFTVEYL